jgi:hypothetical protein
MCCDVVTSCIYNVLSYNVFNVGGVGIECVVGLIQVGCGWSMIGVGTGPNVVNCDTHGTTMAFKLFPIYFVDVMGFGDGLSFGSSKS